MMKANPSEMPTRRGRKKPKISSQGRRKREVERLSVDIAARMELAYTD